MQFSGHLREKPLFRVHFGLRAPPLWVTTPLGPLTKILDPRLGLFTPSVNINVMQHNATLSVHKLITVTCG